jgi:hypothetical protein
MLLKAVIYEEPLINEKSETIHQSKQAQSEGTSLYIKKDNDTSIVIVPYSAGRDPNVRFGDRVIKGIWLTEPAARIHVPMALVVSIYFVAGFACAALLLALLAWLWYFLLSRLRELSQAIHGR